MDAHVVGELRVLAPDLDPRDLDPAEEPPFDGLAEALVTDADWSRIEVGAAQVRLSHLVGVNLANAELLRTTLYGCRFERVDLSSVRLADVTIERCEFVGCRLTGAQFVRATLKNVYFEDCRLDYAALARTKSTGPAAFVDCNLDRARLTQCELPGLALRGCSLEEWELDECDLRGADLRGNDLSTMVGVANLRGGVITADQVIDLALPLARDLRLTVRDATPAT